jgi:hypothetical protein
MVDQPAVRADEVVACLAGMVDDALAEQGFTGSFTGNQGAEEPGQLGIAGFFGAPDVWHETLAELELIKAGGNYFFDGCGHAVLLSGNRTPRRDAGWLNNETSPNRLVLIYYSESLDEGQGGFGENFANRVTSVIDRCILLRGAWMVRVFFFYPFLLCVLSLSSLCAFVVNLSFFIPARTG